MPVTRALVHLQEGGFDESPKLESISDLVENDSGCIVWLDIQDPTDEDIELLRNELHFHALVDGYFPVIDEISEEIEEIESAMFGPQPGPHQAEIFGLKRELLNFRKVLAPEREVLNTLIRRDEPLLGENSLPYFQDVYDH